MKISGKIFKTWRKQMNAQINFDTMSLCHLAYDLCNHEMGSQVDNSIFISQSVSDIRCSGQYWNSDLRHHRRELEGIVFFFSLEFDEYFQYFQMYATTEITKNFHEDSSEFWTINTFVFSFDLNLIILCCRSGFPKCRITTSCPICCHDGKDRFT